MKSSKYTRLEVQAISHSRVQNFQENLLAERTWPADGDASSTKSLQRWHMLTSKATLSHKLCHLTRSSNADIAMTVSASITHDPTAGGQSKNTDNCELERKHLPKINLKF